MIPAAWFPMVVWLSLGQSEPVATAQQSASIQGRVYFKGDPSAHFPLQIDTGGHSYCASITDLTTEQVLLKRSGDKVTIKNVLVFLADAKETRADWLDPVVFLDMKDCRFVPHVLAMHTRQQLMIANRDDTPHSVHLFPNVNKEHNVLMRLRNMQMAFRLKPEPQPFRVESDHHPWMIGWVAVFAHPYFAVTDAEGRFAIDRIPPGAYKVKAWHEKLGVQVGEVELKGGDKVNLDFSFDSPPSDADTKDSPRPAGEKGQPAGD